jgi:malonyl CoA-acyl carrier protein transacylase/3-oxoacyl-(acyl-carrier-protein) synthase/NAD(P)-dependent dehydrogenase (short-subunit alcohol dehydrogenase family)/acyl carrier protein
VAFLYPGQGSQYVNMLKPLREMEPIVSETFDEADRVMKPLLGKLLSEFIFVDKTDADAVARAEDGLRQTAITQPAVLATDLALTRMLAAYGIKPDFAMGHSLGEYGALVAVDALPFADALEAVSARGRGMTQVAMKDNGRMAAVFAPLTEIERILKTVDGYVVIANINSEHQAVIGGASDAVVKAMEVFQKAGYDVSALSVSHAFHTSIVAPASEPLRRVLERLRLTSPTLPIVANTNGEFYPMGTNVVPQMLDILAQQVAAPVQFVKGLRTLYEAGARVFVEVGPKKALQGCAEDVLGKYGDVITIFTNHPKNGDLPAFNQALCSLYAAGLGRGIPESAEVPAQDVTSTVQVPATASVPTLSKGLDASSANGERYIELGRMFADVLERGWQKYYGDKPAPKDSPVSITGAALGLPGTERIFDDGNIGRILHGDQFIGTIPVQFRQAMVAKHITRLVKSDNGGPTFETITNVADVIKLAGRGGTFDLQKEYGVASERMAALDRDTQLAIAVGMDALRDAGIPLVMRYKTTSKGTQLPDRWVLPEILRDDTGVIFASAFPGYEAYAHEMELYYRDQARREQLASLESMSAKLTDESGRPRLEDEIEQRIEDLREEIERHPYVFDRRFLFRVLSMGHSQFAEFIGARGPNTQINSACASTTQAITLAEDWIRAGRCRRVIVVAADDITSDQVIDWFAAGFLATGAAATDESVEQAALPFDRRRHGMIIGMGAAGFVIESNEAARERGIEPICEVLSTITANSAFHGTRLDVEHICQVMEDLIARAENQHGIQREQIAPRTVFISHETYTPARGGSAAAEIHALRRVFGNSADHIVIANTKGFTGHAMAAGIEDVLAVKTLETGIVPPVANFKEVDPELGVLNLSKGGQYPVEYALRLAAGFGSQISMTLSRLTARKDSVRPAPASLGYAYRIADSAAWNSWLQRLSGQTDPVVEVALRTLRIRDTKENSRVAEAKIETKPPVPEPSTILPAKEAIVQPKPAITVTAPPQSATTSKGQVAKTDEKPRVQPAEISKPNATDAKPGAGAVVQERILALVVEKTGYPMEMLDLDLDLEADLGVDTVKQAEMFAAIREIYNIPRDENLKLRDYPTLKHVIRFVEDKRPDLAAATATAKAAPTAVQASVPSQDVVKPTGAAEEVKERILALVVEKTGYPMEMLDLDLDLEADLGVDTVKQAEMFAAIREIYKIPRDENLRLRDYPTLKHVIRFVEEKRPDLASGMAVATKPPQAAADVQVVAPTSEVIAPTNLAEDVKERILALVVEKTGYPKEMLDLELDLEADLGVDTVKQAEMFAAIREIYNIPRDESRKLRDYPTLAHVIRFVYEKRPDLDSTRTSALTPTQKIQPETPAAVAPPASGTPTTSGAIRDKVLDIVAEKTGYPREMLDLDLDLEADLGVDTVKQAEMFVAIRATYNIPRDENLKLRDFPTLAHVIKFAEDHANTANTKIEGTSQSTPEAAPKPAKLASAPRKVTSLDAANSIPRRVPVPVLRPPLKICKSTGVTVGAGSRVIVMPDAGGVADQLIEKLKARKVEVLQLNRSLDPEGLKELLKTWTSAGPVHGVYWLPAVDVEQRIAQMDSGTWREAVRVRIKALYSTMRALYDHIGVPGSFLVTATRLGGHHGYDPAGAVAPLGGSVVGFAKTYKRERPDACVKAVDFSRDCQAGIVADRLIEETLFDTGAVEIGYQNELRWTIGLEESPAADGNSGMVLDEKTVIVITGAAGSIVSAITADLAAASGGNFYLLDLVPEPAPNNPDLDRFVKDKHGLKRDLFGQIQARGERATPALVEKELASLERALAARTAIDAVRSAGGTAHYFSLNLSDTGAVAKVIERIRETEGHIDVLLHAAGLDRSRRLAEKPPEEFDVVFDVKSDGFYNLLHAIGDMPLRATVAFSSIAGRFGNPGQTDYSSANDLLCKISSSMRTTHPQTRAIAIDWTAWGGIGMATRGSIPKVMEMAGIDMLPPEAGVQIVRRELTAGGTRGEIVIGQRLGVLLNEWEEAGGIDASKIPANEKQAAMFGPMLGKIVSAGLFKPLTFITELDPKIQPFLYDHQIDGTPVLPGVMGIEAFAEAAHAFLPEWRIVAVENVNFQAPFKFYRNEPRTLQMETRIRPDGQDLIADCRLLGQRQLPTQKELQITTHFIGQVRLARNITQTAAGCAIEPAGAVIEASDIYKLYFHGPAYQVIERAWWDGNQVIGLMPAQLPANHHPSERPLAVAPRLIELCFQTAGIWEMGVKGSMGLPHRLDQVSILRSCTADAREHLYSVVTPRPDGMSFDAQVVDEKRNCYLRLVGYRTVEVPNAIDREGVKRLQSAMSLQPVAA